MATINDVIYEFCKPLPELAKSRTAEVKLTPAGLFGFYYKDVVLGIRDGAVVYTRHEVSIDQNEVNIQMRNQLRAKGLMRKAPAGGQEIKDTMCASELAGNCMYYDPNPDLEGWRGPDQPAAVVVAPEPMVFALTPAAVGTGSVWGPNLAISFEIGAPLPGCNCGHCLEAQARLDALVQNAE